MQAPTVATVAGQNVGAFTVGGAGLATLRPERINEAEAGFDLGLFGGRTSLEATYFAKASRDALIAFPLASSAGGPLTQYQNIGRVTNKGLELSSTINAVDRRNVQFSTVLNFSTLANKLVGLRPGLQPAIGNLLGTLSSARQGIVPGYALGAYFQTHYAYSDANGNGIIERNEVKLDSVNTFARQYAGNTLPKRSFSVQPTLRLFQNLFRVQALFDYRGGFYLFNATEQFRCASTANCRALYDKSTSLDQQAAAVAAIYYGTNAGYIQKADFTKLRELSLNIGVPSEYARRYLRARGASLNLAARNLKTWTKYKGLDPEVNYSGSGSNLGSADFLTLPPTRYYVARVNIDF